MHLHDGASAERESLRGDQVSSSNTATIHPTTSTNFSENLHLHSQLHPFQIAAVLAWMAAREADADGGCVLLGDLNAAPHEKAHELLAAHGFAVCAGGWPEMRAENSQQQLQLFRQTLVFTARIKEYRCGCVGGASVMGMHVSGLNIECNTDLVTCLSPRLTSSHSRHTAQRTAPNRG